MLLQAVCVACGCVVPMVVRCHGLSCVLCVDVWSSVLLGSWCVLMCPKNQLCSAACHCVFLWVAACFCTVVSCFVLF